MLLTLKILCDNDSFVESETELARLLTLAARLVREDRPQIGHRWTLRDTNGNTVGRMEMIDTLPDTPVEDVLSGKRAASTERSLLDDYPVPKGKRRKVGVEYGCGNATCGDCYEAL